MNLNKSAPWITPLVLAGLCLGLFSPFFLVGRVLAPLDIVTEMYQPWRGTKDIPQVHNHFVVDAVTNFIPHRLLLHRALRQDGYVGWNRFLFGGMAQQADTMLIRHEVTMDLHRFLNFWTAWTMGRFWQLLVAGVGMLFFLRGRGCASDIALLGAVAYMLNQQFVAWIYFNQVVAAFCWMPWALWALFRAWGGAPRFVVVAGLFICLALLGATLQQAAFLVAALGAIWFGQMWDDKRNRLPTTLSFFTAGFLGAGLAAFSWQPCMEAFFENAAAGHGRGSLSYEHGGGQPFLNILASPLTAYPFLLGSVQSLDLWKLFKLDLFYVGFFGTLPMAIAWIGFFSRKVSLAPKVLMFLGIVVPWTPLVGYLYHRFNVVWILGGCWSACAWLAATEEKKLHRVLVRWGRPIALFLGIWLLASVALTVGRPWIEPWLQGKVLAASGASNFGSLGHWMEARAARLIGYLCLWNPWQILGWVGFLLSWWGLCRIKMRHSLSLLPAFGVFLQLSVFWWQWTTWSRPSLPYNSTPLEDLLKKEVGTTGRLAMDTQSSETHFLPFNTLMPAGISVTEGYDAMHPNGMQSPTGLKWDFPGTTHFMGKLLGPHPGGWTLIWQSELWGLWRHPNPSAGRVFLSPASLPVPLGRESIQWPTYSTMEVKLPAGTHQVEIYSNWHRGWLWQVEGSDRWSRAEVGENRTIQVDLPSALWQEAKLKLRYDPSPPAWVYLLSGASLAAAMFFFIFSPRSFCPRR